VENRAALSQGVHKAVGELLGRGTATNLSRARSGVAFTSTREHVC